MEFWSSEKEPIEVFLKLFDRCMEDGELGESIKGVNQLVWFDCTADGPECSFWVDCRGGSVSSGRGKPVEEPDLALSLSADDAHRYWSNRLGPVAAITKKKVIVRGQAAGFLKLAPKLKKVADIYNGVLDELGLGEKKL
jgi:hypothetical protein